MKKLVASLISFVGIPLCAFAELVVTPFGVFDPEENVKISFNVKTDSGVQTRSRIVKGEKVSDKKKLDDFVEKIGGVKFVLSPETAETIESEKTFCIRTRPDLRATATSFRTKIFSRVKSQLIVETRKYYLENIPNATFPNGSFFNPAGGSMVLVGKDKKPIGTLIISYSVKFENPELRDLESAEFVTISDIPDTWEKLPRTRAAEYYPEWRDARLPSGEKVCYKNFGKTYRVVAWRGDVTVNYTFNKLTEGD